LCALRCDLDRARIALAAPEAAPAHAEALALLREVEREAEHGGFTEILVEAQRRRGEHSSAHPSALPAPSTRAWALSAVSEPPALRRRGQFWIVRWGRCDIQLADAKGVRYVAQLLARPGQELGALELLTGGAGLPADATDGLPPSGPLHLMGDLGPTL